MLVLRDRLLLMGGEVELALQFATTSLVKRDSAAAERVFQQSRSIGRLKGEIDVLGVEVLALRRPVASELRAVVSIIKITPVLERIAGHATSIARAALLLNDEPEINCRAKLEELAGKTIDLLHAALDTFTENDSGEARRLIARDAEIDRLYHNLLQEWMLAMSRDPAISARLARLLFIAKNLERIGDYVKSICEETVYVKEAVFINHSSNLDLRFGVPDYLPTGSENSKTDHNPN